MDARSKYLARKNTPTPFSQGPEMQNYTQMMKLQNQASSFAPNDPRIQELKDRRRQYNRQDKYKIGEKFNVSPLDVQRDFANRSETLRLANPAAYKQMYPITSAVTDYIGSGGLLGMMAKKMFNKVRDTGSDMAQKKGIFGAVDTDEGEMQDYAAQTFGMGTPYPQQDFPVVYPQDKPIGRTFEQEGGNKYFNDLTPEELAFVMGQTDTIADEDMNIPTAPTPFNDSFREAGIASMYNRGPQLATNNRRYENEYRNFIANMSDTLRQFGPVTYEEFADMYEKRYQGKPQMDFSRTMTLR